MQTRDSQKALTAEILCKAAFSGDIDTVSHIVQRFGADNEIMNHTQESGETALILAAMRGQTEIVRILLLASSLNPSATNHTTALAGNTALHLAASNGQTDIVKLLAADARSMANLTNARGETALILSTIWCTSAVNNIAKMTNVDPNIKDHHQRSALYYAIARLNKFTPGNRLPAHIATLLALPGIQVNILNHKGWSLLMVAAAKGHMPTVRALLDAGADPSYRARNGFTPAKIAFYAEHTDILKLIETCANEERAHVSAMQPTSKLGLFADASDTPKNSDDVVVKIIKP